YTSGFAVHADPTRSGFLVVPLPSMARHYGLKSLLSSPYMALSQISSNAGAREERLLQMLCSFRQCADQNPAQLPIIVREVGLNEQFG
ncbi:hypothetical protein ABB27_15655, partial [Stenotrophomonas terrae]